MTTEERLYTPDEVEVLEKRIRELEAAIRERWKVFEGSAAYCFGCEGYYAEGGRTPIEGDEHSPDCIVRTLEG